MPPFSFQLYMTFHSYGQYILYPWGYTDEGVPPNYRNLRSLAEVGAAAFRRESGGHRYTMGSAAQVLYPAAGERQQTLVLYIRGGLSFYPNFKIKDKN